MSNRFDQFSDNLNENINNNSNAIKGQLIQISDLLESISNANNETLTLDEQKNQLSFARKGFYWSVVFGFVSVVGIGVTFWFAIIANNLSRQSVALASDAIRNHENIDSLTSLINAEHEILKSINQQIGVQQKQILNQNQQLKELRKIGFEAVRQSGTISQQLEYANREERYRKKKDSMLTIIELNNLRSKLINIRANLTSNNTSQGYQEGFNVRKELARQSLDFIEKISDFSIADQDTSFFKNYDIFRIDFEMMVYNFQNYYLMDSNTLKQGCATGWDLPIQIQSDSVKKEGIRSCMTEYYQKEFGNISREYRILYNFLNEFLDRRLDIFLRNKFREYGLTY